MNTTYEDHMKMFHYYRRQSIGRAGAIIPNSLKQTHKERKQVNAAHAQWHLEQARRIRDEGRQ